MGERTNPDRGLIAEPSTDRKPRTRALLMRRMVEVAADLGYTQGSVDRVVEGTGLARSTFYEHFRDWEDCFLSAQRTIGQTFLSELGGPEDEVGPGLAGLIRGSVRFAEHSPAAAKLLFVESLAAGPRPQALRCAQLREVADRLGRPSGQGPCSDSESRQVQALAGGIFRLLAIRLRSPCPELVDLEPGLCTWVECYGDGARTPQGKRLPRPIGAQAAEALPSLDTGPAVPETGQVAARNVGARRERLTVLDALVRCCYERGYAAVTITEIAAEAGVSRKAFYRHFASKEVAAREMSERVFQAGMAACAGGFFSVSSWPERTWNGGLSLLSFLAHHRDGAYLAFVESPAIGEEARDHAYERALAFTLFLGEGYRLNSGAESLPQIVSEALMATMYEWAYHELRERRSVEGLLGELPELTYTILVPFMGSEAAGEFVEEKMREVSERS